MTVDERVAWLTGAIDETERVAREAVRCAYPYDREPPTGHWRAAGDGRVEDENGETVTFDEGAPTDEQRLHIATHDPQSVLARVEADRGVLARHCRLDRIYPPDNPYYGGPSDVCAGCGYIADGWQPRVEHIADCPEIRSLLSAHRYAPGFKEEWLR